MELEQLLRANNGVVSAAQLRGVGIGVAATEVALEDGRLIRLRKGWYRTSAPVNDLILRAVRHQGALTCASACAIHGLWVPSGLGLHVRRSAHLRNLPAHGFTSCSPAGVRPPVHRAVDPLGLALRCAVRCLDRESAVVLLDSALNLGRLHTDELPDLFSDGNASVRRLLRRTDPRAGSGTETLARIRLRGRRLRVSPQVHISGVGWVDLVIGDRLVVEIDSLEHHSRGTGYEKDRERDRRLIAMGYLVIRVSHHQVLHCWDDVEQTILAVVRRRDHLWPRRR